MSNKGSQPLRSKFLLISPSSSSNRIFLSAQIFLLRLNFSYVSWFFSLRNLSLSKVGTEEEEDFLLALVFLNMMLKSRRTNTEEIEEKKKQKTKGRLKLAQKYIEIIILYDA